MFYCEECRKMNKWPESMAMSIGPCEICENMRSCYDVKASNLPPTPSDKSKHTGIDCPVCSREFFVGDIINHGNIRKINSHDDLVEALEYIQEQMECPAIQNEGDWQTGMFCGLEDRGITNRYDACIYGYNHAIERIEEWALSGIKQALAAAKS